MTYDEFLRVHSLRTPNIMWFLGAGASAAAGVKTAQNMIWDFKASLFCTKNGVSPRSCPPLSDERFRSRIQHYLDSLGGYPADDAPDEYAFYFEAACPTDQDRRLYVERMLASATPSFGQKALAVLMKADRVRIVWTTNFDRLIEDAFVSVCGSSSELVVAALGEPAVAREALNEGRYPMLIKLHGDYHSRRLKNTSAELMEQDQTMRLAFVDSCQRSGLAVVGCSGRDKSVMDALTAAVDSGIGFPKGLFWFVRSLDDVGEAVRDFIGRAQSSGIDAHLVQADTFDELMADAVSQTADVDLTALKQLRAAQSRVSPAPLPRRDGEYPILRLNAVPVTQAPTLCRLVQCGIGGTAEVRAAVERAGAQVVAARCKAGVIAFGEDDEVRRAFAPYDIQLFDVHPIEEQRFHTESAELGLVYDALGRALERQLPLLLADRRSGLQVRPDPSLLNHERWKRLSGEVGALSGTVPRTSVRWSEAARIGLEHRMGQLWLLISPCVWFERCDDDRVFDISKEFARQRNAKRYNKQWNNVLRAWIDALTGKDTTQELAALGATSGIDAKFVLLGQTARSFREYGQ